MKTNSLCQLNSYDFTKLSIQWKPSPDRKEFEIDNLVSHFDYDVWQNTDHPRLYLMRFGTTFQEETPDNQKLGYQIEAEIFANLELSEEVEAEKQALFVRQNGVSILLGIIRTQVAMNTGSFIGGKLVIPTLMPNEIVKEVEASTKKASPTQTPKKTARKKAKSPVKPPPRKRIKTPSS